MSGFARNVSIHKTSKVTLAPGRQDPYGLPFGKLRRKLIGAETLRMTYDNQTPRRATQQTFQNIPMKRLRFEFDLGASDAQYSLWVSFCTGASDD